jgi:succinoglycan biosynthesis protein ExoM
MTSTRPHITICICTYKRPELLIRLLTKLETQQSNGLFDYSIVIVDNDKLKSAYQPVSAYAMQSTINISYYVEPEQNIALARNKTLENAKGDFVSFIDDDEFPENHWLLNLYKAINQYKSDGILGPVVPHFETAPPRWVLEGRFFDRPTHPSGYVLGWTNTRTGNALLKKDIFKTDIDRFDPAFGSGGEDRDFFRRMITKGHIFIWSNEAPVFETIPPYRWDKNILIKRALLRGKMALNSADSKLLSVFVSTAAIIIYTCCLPLFFVMGRHFFMKYLIKTCDHIGKVAAFLKINLVSEKYIGI